MKFAPSLPAAVLRHAGYGFLCLGLLSAPSRAAAAEQPRTLPLGAPAPNFNLAGVDGRRYSLKSFASARILVVVFTCNHCPTAQAYEPRLHQLVVDYQPKGVAVVAINPNDPGSVRLDELGYTDMGDTFAEMKIRARNRKFNYPYLYDGENERVSRAYGPVATPHAFVFDAQRRLRYVGRIDDSERPQWVKTRDLRDALDALLAGREVKVKHTPVFGCSIKWAGKTAAVKQYLAKLAAEPVTVQRVDAAGLAALRQNDSGKLRLVNFWATWCGPCVAEFPELVTIDRMYRHRAFEFVSVSANYPDEQRDVLAFLKKQQASNRNLLFGETDKYKLMAAFDPDWSGALPFTMLIGADGKVLFRSEGEIDPLALRRLIVKSLKEDRFHD